MGMHDDTVRQLMNQPPVDVHSHWTLRGVARTLAEGPIGAVVVRGERPTGAPGARGEGIVSERDIVRALAADMDLDTTRVEDLMTGDLVCAEPDESVLVVATRMLDNEIRHIPVVENGFVIGMVSERDLLRALVADREGSTRG